MSSEQVPTLIRWAEIVRSWENLVYLDARGTRKGCRFYVAVVLGALRRLHARNTSEPSAVRMAWAEQAQSEEP